MTDWQPIETAPKDGTKVVAGSYGKLPSWMISHPITARFIGGVWCGNFGLRKGVEDWQEFQPQPTHWVPWAAGRARVLRDLWSAWRIAS